MQDTRRRSKRLKKAESSLNTTQESKNLSQDPPCVISQGCGLLPTLADELLMEIMSYFPSFTPPTHKRRHEESIKVHNSRREILHSLSQTCCNLRRFFLPYAWEYIEVYPGLYLGGATLPVPHSTSMEREMAMELVRQLEIVTIRIPSLAKHVRSVLCICIFIPSPLLTGQLIPE